MDADSALPVRGSYMKFGGFPGGSVVKNQPANAGDTGSIPGSGRFPWRRTWQPTPVFLPGKSKGQNSLVGSMGSPRVRHDRNDLALTHAYEIWKAKEIIFLLNWLFSAGKEGCQGDEFGTTSFQYLVTSFVGAHTHTHTHTHRGFLNGQ